MKEWTKLIFSDEWPFEEKALRVFEYQYRHNAVYRRYCEALGIKSPDLIRNDFIGAPLLTIRAFKDAELSCSPAKDPDLVFRSSGTSGMERSRHLVADAELYRESIMRGFNTFYNLDKSVIWAYTPGYNDNPDSSLVWMLKELIRQDTNGLSRFLPLDTPLQPQDIEEVSKSGNRLILFGAAFGLLDLLELNAPDLPTNTTVIETGGMKTHRRSMGRKEMHRKMAKGFGLAYDRIHSEYGMAELLSQAYATGGSWFRSVPWMQVTVRHPDDPAEVLPPFREGLIGVIDLANVHSCSFLLTGDKGVMDKKGRFQVLGRWSPKDLRGCNFLIEED